MNNQINLEEKTVVELKALAYDQLNVLQQIQNNINLINQHIEKKTKEVVKAEEVEEVNG